MFKWIRRFWERGRKGYCYEDLWEWDNFFSKLVATSLREFRQHCHCYPNEDITWEGWMAVLDEMIECFEEQTRGIDNFPEGNFLALWKKRQRVKKQKLHRGLELLEKYYYDLWD